MGVVSELAEFVAGPSILEFLKLHVGVRALTAIMYFLWWGSRWLGGGWVYVWFDRLIPSSRLRN